MDVAMGQIPRSTERISSLFCYAPAATGGVGSSVLGFCLTGPVSLYLDSFVFIFVYFVFFSYCVCVVLLQHGG